MLLKLLRTTELAEGARVHRVGCHSSAGGNYMCSAEAVLAAGSARANCHGLAA